MTILSGCCFPGKKEVGQINLSKQAKEFFPYKGNENLVFKTKKGKELKYSVKKIETGTIKVPATMKESCEYSTVEFMEIIFQTMPQSKDLQVYLSGENGEYLFIEYGTRFYFPTPLDSACNKQDSIFICNDTLTINYQKYTDIFRIKDYETFQKEPGEIKYMYYSKKLGVCRFSTYSGDDYFLEISN